MKKIHLFIILIAVSSTIAFAQNKDTKKADDLYNRLAYTDAAVAYQKLLKKGKGNRYVYEQLANSYYFINDSKKAEEMSIEAVKRSKSFTWSVTAARLRRICSDLQSRSLVDCA
mgnify:CR=1 FL=1